MSEPIVVPGSSAYRSPNEHPVVTIGNFDGVHRGHRVLVAAAVKHATALGVPACVYTFDPAPRDVLRPGNPVPRIQTLADKIRLLGTLGVDCVVVEPFTREFGRHGGKWFAEEVLTRRLGASAVVVGWDFRFGAGREGTVDALRDWMTVPVTQVNALESDDGVISSSRIRGALAGGRVEEATALLARPHCVQGTVVHGDARGRTIGIRTANLENLTGLVPADGVYAVMARVGQVEYRAVANIGSRPSFPGAGRSVEVHLLDIQTDVYDAHMTVHWHHRLRDERTFSSPADLVAQIGTDIAAARTLLS
ncbi:MAG: riboflavin kinase/FMN adenylyltransferase [Myxococcota bacterium]